jgi:hypothetical protein
MTGAAARAGPRSAKRRTAQALLAGALMLAAAAAVPATPASAPQSARGGAVPQPVAAHISDARLAGEGLLRWFGLRVYEARLWTGPRAPAPETLARSAFALELRYARALEGRAIAAASRDEIARLDLGTPAQLSAWFDAMARLFPDVAQGDRLTGVNLPGSGVAFYRNDRPLGSIDDPDFGPAFFAIWLHRDTAAPELRRSLLERAGTRGAGDR